MGLTSEGLRGPAGLPVFVHNVPNMGRVHLAGHGHEDDVRAVEVLAAEHTTMARRLYMAH